MVTLAGAAALAGCSPALDWREVRLEAAPLKTMLPCKPERESRFVPNGALDLPRSVQVVANGQRPDGRAVEAQVTYFARGNHVFQAAVYSERLEAEATEPFFAGLRFE